MDSLNHTPTNNLLNTSFALLLSGLSWAFALANLQSLLSIMLSMASLAWVLIQIRGRLRQDTSGREAKAPRCPNCNAD